MFGCEPAVDSLSHGKLRKAEQVIAVAASKRSLERFFAVIRWLAAKKAVALRSFSSDLNLSLQPALKNQKTLPIVCSVNRAEKKSEAKQLGQQTNRQTDRQTDSQTNQQTNSSLLHSCHHNSMTILNLTIGSQMGGFSTISVGFSLEKMKKM